MTISSNEGFSGCFFLAEQIVIYDNIQYIYI